MKQPTGALWLAMLALALALAGFWWSGSRFSSGTTPLVVYCAHDAVYADEILRRFEIETGIPVEIRYDTEATKSLGLVQLIDRQRSSPQADVFWNNELLGTLHLAEQGLLEPYQGAGWQRMPETYRDADSRWVGFGARMRVWIVNTRQMTADEAAVEDLLNVEATRVAMAQPMFGTTLTHYCVLAREWGLERLQEWHAEVRGRGVREVAGNGLVKDLVAAGSVDCGWTDTDDVFVALDDEKPVEMFPIRISGKVVLIPNTVAIIKGTERLEAAQRLVDYLTSQQVELDLARSRSRQIPLGPMDENQLPEEVRRLKAWANDVVDLRDLLDERANVLDWLRQEYAP